MPRTAQYLNTLNPTTEQDLENLSDGATFLFTYKGWTEEQIAKGKEIAKALQSAYETIIKNVPASPTRTVALRKLVEARMDANMALTFDGAF